MVDTYTCLSNGGFLFWYLSQVQKSALDMATDKCHYMIMQLLLERGADPNRQDEVRVVYILWWVDWLLFVYTSDMWYCMVFYIYMPYMGIYSLCDSACSGDIYETGCDMTHCMSECVFLLMTAVYSLPIWYLITIQWGRTAVMRATKEDHTHAVEVLIEGGADLNIWDRVSWNVLRYTLLHAIGITGVHVHL